MAIQGNLDVYSMQAVKYQEKVDKFKLNLDEILKMLEDAKNLLSAAEWDTLSSHLYEFDNDARNQIEELKKVADESVIDIKNKAEELDKVAKQKLNYNSNVNKTSTSTSKNVIVDNSRGNSSVLLTSNRTGVGSGKVAMNDLK